MKLAYAAALCLLAAGAHAETYYRVNLPNGDAIELNYETCISPQGRPVPPYFRGAYYDATTGKRHGACWGQPGSGEFAVIVDRRGTYVFQPYEVVRLQR